jgi:uncharacterized protein YkwD
MTETKVPYVTILPFVGSGPQPIIEGQSEDKARQVFERMYHHDDQRRDFRKMQWDEDLAEAAFLKCIAQALEGWTGHVSPEGWGPNYSVRLRTSYKLPNYSHAKDANNCESLAHNGDGSVEGVWASWMASEGHRTHLSGLDDWYAGQTRVGVGFYEGGEERYYWCVLTVHPE